jgi:cell wall-associated NlpC family hydrolase
MPHARGVAGSAARRSPTAALCISALFALLAVTFLVAAPAASAKKTLPGGVSARAGLEAEIPESTEAPTEVESGIPGTGEIETGAAGKAALLGTRAVAPLNAPAAVKRVIAAANYIRTLPYVWGGGHGNWISSGYDCSGAVSYALHGGKLLTTPLTSGSMETFGEAGPGRWITIYANASHAYMVVAGLRFDTAGDTSGTGPRWHPTTAAAASGTFVVRHPVGY